MKLSLTALAELCAGDHPLHDLAEVTGPDAEPALACATCSQLLVDDGEPWPPTAITATA